MPSETAQQTEEIPAEPGIETLAELLDTKHEAGASEGEPHGSAEKSEPTKFNDLAERLGVELDALYKLEISQAEDGTPVTVETLKDFYAEQGNLTLREVEFEERKTQAETELMKAQAELRELMAELPEKALKPETLQKLRERHEATVQLERQRTMQAIPEWSDDKTRTADIEGMVEHLQQYGYPPSYLEQIADHRQIKFIRDSWLRETRIRKALEQVRAGRPNPTSKSKPASKAPQRAPLTGVSRGNARNKLEAIFSQLD